jgi:ribosome-associated heat shock protein Hsp15
LDLFLHYARFAKSRAIAQELARTGLIRIDGRRITTAHADVRPDQIVTMALHGHVRAIRVLSLPARRGPAPEARSHYVDLLAQEPIDAGGA